MATYPATNSDTLLPGSTLGDSLTAAGYERVTLVGNGGADTFNGGPSGSLVGGSGADVFYDTVTGGGYATMVGSTGTNTYYVNSTTDKITDSGSGSVINSSVGFDLSSTLVSGVNNLLYTGSGSVSLLGNTSANSISAASATGGVTLSGGLGADTLVGSSLNDTIIGNGNSSDSLYGGSGTNTYIVSSTTDKITDTGTGSIIRSSVGFNLASSLVSGVNNLTYTGGGAVSLLGNSLANTISAATATGGVTLSGGTGADTLIGSSLNDTLLGNGSSSLYGGGGANTYIVSSTTDRIADTGTGSIIRSSVGFDLSSSLVNGVNNLTYTGSGAVSLLGNSLSNTISAATATGGVTLSGGTGADTLIGSSLNDILLGNGASSLYGGGGTNTYVVSSTTDTINGAGGAAGNVIRSSVGFDLSNSLVSGVNNLTYTGGGAVSLLGNSLANTISAAAATGGVTLSGGLGADTLIGSSFNDTLIGNGNANDSLYGGGGTNTYLVTSTVDKINDVGSGSRIITSANNYNLSSANVRGINVLIYDSLLGGGYSGLIGSTLADTISANGGSGMTLTGNGGADSLRAYTSGTLIGGSTNDTLSDGGGAQDTNWGGQVSMWGGAGTNTYYVNSATDTLNDNGTGSVIYSSVGLDLSQATQFQGGKLHILYYTSSLGDSLTGTTLADTLVGDTGDDTIDDGGGIRSDSLVGGSGTNTYLVSNNGDTINDSGINSVVQYRQNTNASFNLSTQTTGIGNLQYTGSGKATLVGSSLSGSIIGGGGNDSISDGGAGLHTLVGGGGADIYVVSNSSDLIDDSYGYGSVIETSVSYDLGQLNQTLAGGIHNLIYKGTGGASLTGRFTSADSLGDSITGGSGDDTLSNGGGLLSNTLIGGGGNDLYYAAALSSIVGGNGNDTFYVTIGGGGYSEIQGNGGTNSYFVCTTSDIITDAGVDSVIYSSVSFDLSSPLVSGVYNLVYTGNDNATLKGGYAAGSLVGSSGNDSISDGGFGGWAETLVGGGGEDTFVVSNSGAVVENSGGTGGVVVTSANYTLGAASGVANMTYGGDGFSGLSLVGNTLSNSIIGGDGNDTLGDGDGGTDTLRGGLGANTYLVSNANNYILDNGSNSIVITPFSTNLASNTLISGINHVQFTGAGGFLSGNNKGDSLIANGGNNTLYGSWKGSGKASTLIGAGDNNTYVVVYNWDTIINTGSGAIINAPGSFDLNSSLVSGVNNLVHSGNRYVAKLVGNSNAGSLIANASNDTLVGGGQNTMIGGSSLNSYTYIVNSTTDMILDSGSNSVIRSRDGYDLSSSLAGGVHILVHTGADGVSLKAGDGADSIFSGYANDTLIDGGGFDTLNGHAGTNTYIVSNPNNRIIDAGKGSQILTSLANYSLGSSLVSGVNNLVYTGFDDASLSGNMLSNSVVGGSGNDTLFDGGGGADTLVGGTGANIYIVSSAIGRIVDSGSDSVIRSSVGMNLGSSLLSGVNNLVYTGSGNVSLVGNSATNSITGGTGNDTLSDGGGGSDTLVGLAGANTYMVSGTNNLIVDAGLGSMIRSSTSFDLSSSLVSGVRRLTYTGSSAASLNGSSLSDSIVGGVGNDTLSDGGGGADTLVGGAGANTYIVTSATDKITDGGSGSVIRTALSSFSLASSLVGGVNNLVYTGSGNASIVGNAKANFLDASGASSALSLSGGVGKDTLLAGSGNDTLVGNGSATLSGGLGVNTYIVSSATDRITDAGSNSVIRSSIGFNLASSLVSGVNNLFYTGGVNVSLNGNSFSNSIIGSRGKDTIQAWTGVAASNTSSDTLTGGVGADSFLLSAVGQSDNAYGNGSGAVANITDFQGGLTGDKLLLHNFGIGHAGSAGYQTLSGGAGMLDIYTYQGTDSNNLVAHVTLASGSFSWTSNASFV